MSDCIFCKIVNNEFDSFKIYEDNDFIAILDKFPSTLGHTLIIPKKHCADLFELDEDLASKVLVVGKKVASALKEVTGCEAMNVLQNNGSLAGQSVFHYHMHLIPRYSENDEFKVSMKANEKASEITDEFVKKISDKIKR